MRNRLISNLFFCFSLFFFLPVSEGFCQNQPPAVAGMPTKFSTDEAAFIQELGAMMRKVKMAELDKSAEDFEALWSGGKMATEHRKEMIQLSNLMLQKRLKANPHFEKVMDLFILAARKGVEGQPFFKLIETTRKVIANMDPNPAFAYVANLHLYFKYNMLFTNGFYKLKVTRPGKMNFDWVGADVAADTGAVKIKDPVANNAFNDWEQETAPVVNPRLDQVATQYQEVEVDLPQIGGPVITFEQVSLKFETGFDSNSIRKTNGTYMIANGTWVGEGGVIDFASAGLKRTEVYCDLKKYSFRVKNPEFHADNVLLYYKNRLEATVLGAFEWKSKRKTSFDEAQYPRFKSYYNESRFKDIKDEGILYLGGFSMEGRRVNSSSVYGGKSMIKLKNGGQWAVSLVSNRFDFNDTTITSASAFAVVYYGQDSIVHPAVRLVYNTVRREIRLYKEKGNYKTCPFFDSGHNMEILTDLLVWDLDKKDINFYILNAKNKVPALFESVDFFTNSRFSELQGLYTFHPLMMLQGYANQVKAEEFNVEDMALKFKQNSSALRSAMAAMANQGFIEYDSRNGNIRLKEKLFHYTNSQKYKKDYDQLSIPSIGPSKYNGQIKIDSSDIIIYGVERFYLSDSLDVYAEPKDKKVVVKGNRNVVFNGKLSAGNFITYGDNFRFDYNEFKIDMGAIDSIEIKTEGKSKGEKSSLSRMYGVDKNATSGESAMGHGTIYINKPDNKSAKKRQPQYPIFDIKTPSFIYFDKQEYLKGKYGTEVYFKIPPFEVDSAASNNSKSVSFDGTFHSDSIFPDFPEKLKIRPDKSLGFVHKTPESGYPLYGTEAKFYGTISMDFKGLRGKGEIKYLNATIQSEDFIFYPDSVIARGRSAKMEGMVIADVAFPECLMDAYAMKWTTKRKSMTFINAKGMPFKLYNKQVSLEGLVSLSPSGLAGRGYIQTAGSRAESERYKFGKDGFSGRKTFFEVKSNNPIKPALACRNVRLDFNIKEQRADFSPEVKGYASNVFPFCQYKTSIPQATWFIEKKLVTMSKPDSVDLKSSYFYSSKKEQDSLYFNATDAIYDIATHNLKISGVPYIHVADAEIKPDSGGVTITEGANMKPLTNATVLVDRTNKFHRLKNANIKILSRSKFEGDGIYQYVNALKDTISIKFNEFMLVDPVADKKTKVDTDEPYTVSGGEIAESRPIKLAQGILFKGNAIMSALKPNLEFEGQIKLDLKKNKNAGWVNYKTDGESKEFVINVAKATDEEGQPLVSGLLIEDGSNKLYSSFLGPIHANEDKPIFLATGILNYVEKTQEFRIGTQERFDEKTYEGNMLVYNDSLSKISVSGKFNFQGAVPDKDFSVIAAGSGSGLVDSSRFVLQTAMAFDLALPAPAWKNMVSTIPGRVTDMGLPEAIDDKAVLAYRLADMAGDKAGKDYEKQNATRTVPIFQAIPKFNKSIFINDVTLNWSPKYRAWYSTGKIGVSHIQGTNINARMEGMIEIRYTGGNPIVNLYLEPSPDSWYYFGYDDLKRLGLRSAQDDFNTAIETKGKEGKEGTFFFVLAEAYEKTKFIKNFKKNYLGIDVGEVVEEKPATQEKKSSDDLGDEEEEKPKDKKEEKKTEEEEDEEAAREKAKKKEKKKEEQPPVQEDDDEFSNKPKKEEVKPPAGEEGEAKPSGEEGGQDGEDKKKKDKKKKKKDDEGEEEPKKDEPKKDEEKDDF